MRLLAHLLAAAFILLLPLLAHAQESGKGAAAAAAAERERLSALLGQIQAGPVDEPKLAEARSLGFELLGASRYEDSWSIFRVVLDRAPYDPQALYGGAVALFNLKRVEQAELLARAAIEAYGVDLSSPISSPASSSASSSVSSGPKNPLSDEAKKRAADALILLGVILAVEKDTAGALKAVTQAVAFAPQSFDAQLALGRARYGSGDPGGAAEAFRAAVALKPGDAKARFFLATVLEAAGDDDGALRAYRELLLVQPASAEGHLGLGVLLVKSGGAHTDEGIGELSRALALNGDLYEGRVTLGRTLVRLGRAAEAIEHLRRAAELAPRNPEPHYQLALAYRRLGKPAEAARETSIVQSIHSARRGENERGSEAGPKKPD